MGQEAINKIQYFFFEGVPKLSIMIHFMIETFKEA